METEELRENETLELPLEQHLDNILSDARVPQLGQLELLQNYLDRQENRRKKVAREAADLIMLTNMLDLDLQGHITRF
jgi:hypothetical protein